MADNFAQYHHAVEYLQTLANLRQPDYLKKEGRSLFLRRIEYFLKLLGNPHRSMHYIHVGGTSGKGSVATMIHSVLTTAGLKTGLYLSPHPTTTIERFKIGNTFISPQEFAEITEEIKPIIDRAYRQSPFGRPSYFEILTAMAFLYFKRHNCQYVVLEVGLGGRYDATNVIPRADITVINKISHDHTEILGTTLLQIAREKAAIIKPHTKFFTTSANQKNILELFRQTCTTAHAPCTVVLPPKTPYRLSLLGDHQQHNAEIAATVARTLGISESVIRAGLQKATLSCRLEIINKKPLIILDGAHNHSKIETVVKTLRDLTYQKLYLIIALTKSRNPVDVFNKLVPLADRIMVTRYLSSERRCLPPLDVAKKLKTKKRIDVFLDADMALRAAQKLARPTDAIMVTGSFYLAGELRQHWRPEETILRERIS